MHIDLQKTIVACFEYGGFDREGNKYRKPVLSTTGHWLQSTFPRLHIRSINCKPFLCARNQAIRDIALPLAVEFNATWFMAIDNDVTITHPGVEDFLKIDADVVSCNCNTRNHRAWCERHSFHTPFWRCRMEVLQAIEPPWFKLVFSPDGCKLLQCECEYFRDKALALGFSVKHGGHCSHSNQDSIS